MANLLTGEGRIYLIGMMGAGKTTIGRSLAERLGVIFVDLDDALENRTGLTVAEIFERHGEFDFRACEAQVLRDLPRKYPDAVIATGGGAPAHFDNVAFMRQSGTVVYLQASADELIGRLAQQRAERPLLKRDDWEAFVAETIAARREAYGQAHASYRVDGQQVDETLAGLLGELEQVVGH